MKSKKLIWITILLLLVSCCLAFYCFTQKIVYMEYIKLGHEREELLQVQDKEAIIEQEFTIPYEMFSGVGITVGTFNRDNNSKYEVTIMDKTEDKQIANFIFNASNAVDNQIYDLRLDSPIKVDNTHQFSVILKARSLVNTENGIGFFADNTSQTSNGGTLYYNHSQHQGNLCMNVYGGNSNTFWMLFILGCEIYIAVLVVYMLYLYTNQKSIRKNAFIQAGLLGIIVFSVLAVFTKQPIFCDEIDNIIGGMLIAKGKVIYVDYYTQHTPIAYFLCSLFAICQAGSVEQFRLIYYVFIAFIYMGLYLRHKDNFGKAKMMILPILQITFSSVLDIRTTMILSDNIQAICMIAFVLEFLQYCKDGKLDWKRSIIVSLSIFGSFGAAFLSIYAIFGMCLGVFIQEILYWSHRQELSFKKCIQRYWKLVIACLIPFVLAFIYFIVTDSLLQAYEQAYQFNTEVYSHYLIDELGTNIIKPFFVGIRNFIQIIPLAINNMINGQLIGLSILEIIADIGILVSLAKILRKKEYVKAITLILFLSFGYVRVGFHLVAFWSSVLTIILVTFDFKPTKPMQKAVFQFTIMLFAIFAMTNYMNQGVKFSFEKMYPISPLEQKIIENTSDGDEIFMDINSCFSVYLIYKDRLPVNRAGYILPWYMDWYESDTLEDLKNKKPKIVIYDAGIEVWEISDFTPNLTQYLQENYEPTKENEILWMLK